MEKGRGERERERRMPYMTPKFKVQAHEEEPAKTQPMAGTMMSRDINKEKGGNEQLNQLLM